jgi:hypothetical protein
MEIAELYGRFSRESTDSLDLEDPSLHPEGTLELARVSSHVAVGAEISTVGRDTFPIHIEDTNIYK